MKDDGRLVKATDDAIERANWAFLESPEAQRRATEDGERWRALYRAKLEAGRYGVVLPARLARELLGRLRGEDTLLPVELLDRMLQSHLDDLEDDK